MNSSVTPHLAPKEHCTGCGACASGCPRGAIRMVPDREGFLYPEITESCVFCGHCSHICPALKSRELRPDPTVFAVWNENDAVRSRSTVGGAFAAIAAFGYPQKARKRMRFNILSMSNVDIGAKRHYFDPKRPVGDMVYLNAWGETQGRDKYIGFYDDMLWEAFYAASLSPSYLNRQAYGFVISDGQVVLVSRPDAYNTEIDGKLSLGVVMLHFAAAASAWAGKVSWKLGGDAKQIELPEGYSVIASCAL